MERWTGLSPTAVAAHCRASSGTRKSKRGGSKSKPAAARTCRRCSKTGKSRERREIHSTGSQWFQKCFRSRFVRQSPARAQKRRDKDRPIRAAKIKRDIKPFRGADRRRMAPCRHQGGLSGVNGKAQARSTHGVSLSNSAPTTADSACNCACRIMALDFPQRRHKMDGVAEKPKSTTMIFLASRVRCKKLSFDWPPAIPGLVSGARASLAIKNGCF